MIKSDISLSSSKKRGVNKNGRKQKHISELRKDLVSGTWVAIATGRAKRPEMFKRKKKDVSTPPSKASCFFCNLEKSDQLPPTTIKKDSKGNWSVVSIPNKFPAFSQVDELNAHEIGPFSVINGVGFHEVIITRDHHKQVGQLNQKEVKEVIDVYQERYLALMNKKFINYIAVFQNQGQTAGASVYHPHSQLIALPVVDPDIHRSLEGSWQYFRANKRCVHCTMVEWEVEQGERIVYKNSEFVAICPFVSKMAFELRIYPINHKAYFEKVTEHEKEKLADVLRVVLNKLYKGLGNPDYNYFIHTAPCDGQSYDHYHWHLEIFPKTSVWAGFEIGTGIEISTIRPETAGKFLRNIKV